MLSRGEMDSAHDPGIVARHEYQYDLPDGSQAVFAVSLRDFSEASATAAFARARGAVAHGLVSIVGVPRAPSRPLVWMHSRQELAVVIGEADPEISEDLQSVLARVLRRFFRDVRHVAPGLAAFLLQHGPW